MWFWTHMPMRLKTVLMASVLATSFLSTSVWAESGSRPEGITSTTDASGRKIYVNDESARGSGGAGTNASAPVSGFGSKQLFR